MNASLGAGDPWYGPNYGLRRVEPYSTGYKLLSSLDHLGLNTQPVWRELEQAIKRLIGVSN
ncbi:hypothetical protein KSC_087340 [Ktedonobacter sp. SOSP1-52]|nr:hypothetical protein KSC_087340 [Ktedonobacter sp. SOSP1-52]